MAFPNMHFVTQILLGFNILFTKISHGKRLRAQARYKSQATAWVRHQRHRELRHSPFRESSPNSVDSAGAAGTPPLNPGNYRAEWGNGAGRVNGCGKA